MQLALCARAATMFHKLVQSVSILLLMTPSTMVQVHREPGPSLQERARQIEPLINVSLCGAVVTTLSLSFVVAQAECSDLVIGEGWSCELFNQCNGWCCHGISQAECDRRLSEAGFEEVEGGPVC
jgi:hypothetical protein